MTPIEQLARDVIEMFALQDAAATTRDMDRTRKAKAARRKVEQACQEILHPKQVQPTLFEEAPGDLF